MKFIFSIALIFVSFCLKAQENQTPPASQDTLKQVNDFNRDYQTHTTVSSDCEQVSYFAPGLVEFPYNTRCKTESYPFITKDGMHLYYTNNKIKDWIYYSTKDEKSGWSTPVQIYVAGFDKYDVSSCYLSPDYATLYITGDDGLFACKRVEGSMVKFQNPIKINFLNSDLVPFSYISFTPDMSTMAGYTGSYNKSTCTYRWAGENTMQQLDVISTFDHEMGILSPDGLTYYFSVGNTIYCRKRNKVNESLSKEYYIFNQFEDGLNINHLRMNGNQSEFVMVLSSKGWENNDIFFWKADTAKRDLIRVENVIATTTPAFPKGQIFSPITLSSEFVQTEIDSRTPVKSSEVIASDGTKTFCAKIGQPFPNPANTFISVFYEITTGTDKVSTPYLQILNMSGVVVGRVPLTSNNGELKVDVGGLVNGFYDIRIEYLGMTSDPVKLTVSR
ncbi:MAG: hypothetical protein H7321_00880 [Bacteroidia bacterium]|nr:hypothetical protein [Bacteroidia bacterium]